MSDELFGFPDPENPETWIAYTDYMREQDYPTPRTISELEVYELPGMYSEQREFKEGLREWMKLTKKRQCQLRKFLNTIH